MDNERLSCRAVAEIFGFAVIVGLFAWKFPTDTTDWAAWVQAFGSIGALRVAIWVFERQRDLDREREAEAHVDSQRNFLLGVKTEILVNIEQYMESIGSKVDAQQAGMLDMLWQRPEKPFLVYEATAHNLGLLSDDVVRKKLITAQSLASGLLAAWQIHNDLVKDWVQQNRDFRLDLASAAKEALTEHSGELRTHQKNAIDALQGAVQCIEAWEQRHAFGERPAKGKVT